MYPATEITLRLDRVCAAQPRIMPRLGTRFGASVRGTLALRHQLTVLHRQLGTERVQFDAGDRAFLAALLHRLPRTVFRRVRLLVRPDTVLRWHRDLLARRHAYLSRPKRPGRPPTTLSPKS